MIKFFRNIRKSVLSKNKFSKYLIYAIGEIVLVMIGILLAFQANQWKEHKAELQLETKLIKEIKNGLQADLIDVKINKESHEKILKNQYKVVDWLKSDLDATDSTTYQFSMATKRTTFLVSKAPFESLKEFGLNRVTNDALKHKIIALYDILYPAYDGVIQHYYNQSDLLFEAGINHFDEWNISPDVFNTKPINIVALKADHTFSMRLKNLMNFNFYLVEANATMETLLIEIIDMIDQDLQNQ